MLLNLLTNAIDAVKGTSVRWIAVETRISEDYVDVLVSDSGPGIPAALREKIMEPFFTIKDVNQGTGLGLSISRKIAHDHGGELVLEPAAPHTTFRVRLFRGA